MPNSHIKQFAELSVRRLSWVRRVRTMLRLMPLLLVCGLVGCDQNPPHSDDQAHSQSSGDGHRETHAHEHAEHGSHGGHIVHLEPDGHHAEWVHEANKQRVTVYLDELSSPASAVSMVVKVGDTEPQTFPLTKSSDGGDGTWSTTSDALTVHLNMGDAAIVELIVATGERQMRAKLVQTHQSTTDHHHHH